MGGTNPKRRFIDAWAWSDAGWTVVELCSEKPRARAGNCWDHGDSVNTCSSIFAALTGIQTTRGEAMPPTRVRIPAWEVLD